MNHPTFFNTPRNREKSVLFWASALVESQRAQVVPPPVPSNALVVLPSIEAAECASVVPDEQTKHGAEEQSSLTRASPPPTSEYVGDVVDLERVKRTRTEAVPEANLHNNSPQRQEEEKPKEDVASSTLLRESPPTRHATNQKSHPHFKDVLQVSDALLQGLLGPVVIDVELNGGITLLRDYEGFVALLAVMEQDSSDAVSNLHAAIRLFFLVRGDSYYMLDSSVLSPVVFLAKLLSAPAVRKILLRAQQLYRLLFLFLGTDRVTVSNLVDVSVWSAVVGRVCGSDDRTKVCTSALDLWQMIPDSARESIEMQMQSAEYAARYDTSGWFEGDESNSEVRMTTTGATAVVAETHHLPSSSHVVSLVQLTERLRLLAALSAYYDAYLRPIESSGATGNVSTPLVSVCHLETRVSFLCEMMSYHGIFIDKPLLDRMVTDLDQQEVAIVQRGNTALQGLEEGVNEKLDLRTLTAKALVEMLRQRFVNLPLMEGNWEQQLQKLNKHMNVAGNADENVACMWLAMHERREFKRSLLDGFSNGVSVHARIIKVPGQVKAGGSGCGTSGGDATSTSTCRLFFTVHPQWAVHHGSTARIFCSRPNLQTLPKKPPLSRSVTPSASSSSEVAVTTVPTLFSNPEWTLRHLYGPPPGCTLLSFDFNQIELRVLAHFSRDELLVQQLSSGTDVLKEMALRIMGLQRLEDVSPHMRQSTKVLVYGMVYGMGPDQLDQRMCQVREGSSVESVPNARQLIRSFNHYYPGVHSFLKHTRLRAFHEKRCATLNGLRDLSSEPDGNRRKQMAVALVIQGGAAVILHHAMVEVHEKRHEFIPFFPASPLALVMSVHDELVYATPDSAVGILAPQVKHILERQAEVLSLRVPLLASVKAGKTLGTLKSLPV